MSWQRRIISGKEVKNMRLPAITFDFTKYIDNPIVELEYLEVIGTA